MKFYHHSEQYKYKVIYVLHFVDLISYGKIAFLPNVTKHVNLNPRRALREGLK